MPQIVGKSEQTLRRLFIKYHKLAGLAVAAILLLTGFLFALKPKYDQVKLAGALNIKTNQEQLSANLEYLKQLRQFQKNYNQLSDEDIIKLNFALPKLEDIPGLFVQLENLARLSGFNLLSADISAVENVRDRNRELAGIKKQNIAITVEGGNYSAFKNLLKEIELNLRLLDVNSINFTSGSNLYTVNLSTYYFSAD